MGGEDDAGDPSLRLGSDLACLLLWNVQVVILGQKPLDLFGSEGELLASQTFYLSSCCQLDYLGEPGHVTAGYYEEELVCLVCQKTPKDRTYFLSFAQAVVVIEHHHEPARDHIDHFVDQSVDNTGCTTRKVGVRLQGSPSTGAEFGKAVLQT